MFYIELFVIYERVMPFQGNKLIFKLYIFLCDLFKQRSARTKKIYLWKYQKKKQFSIREGLTSDIIDYVLVNVPIFLKLFKFVASMKKEIFVDETNLFFTKLMLN